MTTATEQSGIDLERSSKLYRTDRRAQQIVDMCVANALNEQGEPDDYNYRRFAHRVAELAAATLLRYIYDGDGEINRLAVERDHYKRIAEDVLRFASPTVAIASITGAAIADTLPTGPGRETGPVREQG